METVSEEYGTVCTQRIYDSLYLKNISDGKVGYDPGEVEDDRGDEDGEAVVEEQAGMTLLQDTSLDQKT